MNGYDDLRLGAAWLDLSQRTKIIATGEDGARLLHAMTTNHVAQLQPGTGCYAFFLSAQGRILSDVNLICLTIFCSTRSRKCAKNFSNIWMGSSSPTT